MILKLTTFTAVVCGLVASSLGTPQYQHSYGVPSFAAPAPAPFQTFQNFQSDSPAPRAPFQTFQNFQSASPAPRAPFQTFQSFSAAPPAPQAPFQTFQSFQAAPPALRAPASLGFSQQEDAELLPPLQHVVGTKYPAVNPGRGFKFPISQLLNPTPPPNLKH